MRFDCTVDRESYSTVNLNLSTFKLEMPFDAQILSLYGAPVVLRQKRYVYFN